MAPANGKKRYNKNALLLTIPHIAGMAGNVVTGPSIRKARAAAGSIPIAFKLRTISKAVMLLVYAGMPMRVAITTAKGLLFESTPVNKSGGKQNKISVLIRKARVINFEVINNASRVSVTRHCFNSKEISLSAQHVVPALM